MILLHIAAGVVRPSDIARRMGVSRQAVHTTIAQLSDMDIVRLKTDPEDGRHKYLVLTETGSRMRDDAQEAMDAITGSVGDSIGVDAFDQMMTALSANWTIR
jgi:DNA-binding MarR family transcriptional regulator